MPKPDAASEPVADRGDDGIRGLNSGGGGCGFDMSDTMAHDDLALSPLPSPLSFG